MMVRSTIKLFSFPLGTVIISIVTHGFCGTEDRPVIWDGVHRMLTARVQEGGFIVWALCSFWMAFLSLLDMSMAVGEGGEGQCMAKPKAGTTILSSTPHCSQDILHFIFFKHCFVAVFLCVHEYSHKIIVCFLRKSKIRSVCHLVLNTHRRLRATVCSYT